MCACSPSHVCRRCDADDYQRFHRLIHEVDPREVDEQRRDAELSAVAEIEPGITKGTR